MDLNQQFEEAVVKAKQLPNQSNENLLLIYSLYKQATEGDISEDRPSNPFDFVGNAKYNAWEKHKGMSKDEAKKQYIDLIDNLGK